MAAQTEHVLTRARERFAVQDYYGTVHLLEEIVAGGRAFADVHHLLGVSLSLLGQRERALAEFRRALELNPRYLEALIHHGLILYELGRDTEAEDSFRRASASVSPSSNGLPAPISAQLANQHAELAEAYAEAGALDKAVEQYQRALELGPSFVDLRYRMARLHARVGPLARGAGSVGGGAPPATQFRGCRRLPRPGPLPLGRRHGRAGHLEGMPPAPPRECPRRGLPRDARSYRLVRRWAFAAAALCAACGGGTDVERRGDEAYGRGRYADALKEYRTLAGGKADPRIWAKTGAAALRAGELREAADAYLHLAGEDPGRIQEAAEGLEEVARAAERADRDDALQQAVIGLQTVAPDRVPTAYALRPGRARGRRRGGAGAAAAPRHRGGAGPGGRPTRSSPSTRACSSRPRGAARPCSSTAPCCAARRTAPSSPARGAARPTARSRWASARGSADGTTTRRSGSRRRPGWIPARPPARTALFAYGETRLNQGDTLAAALAFQAIVSDQVVSDSFGGKARARLAALGLTATTPVTTPDTP